MKTRSLLVLLTASALLMAGCAASPAADSTPTPTETEPANADACGAFAELVLTIPESLESDGPANEMWETVRVDFDEVALTAEGVVQERMLDLVEWPRISDVLIYDGVDTLNEHFAAVDRACKADGVRVSMPSLTTV